MKVILQQDVKKVGKKGEIIEVSEGYGRNFLLPKKYAVEATASNLNVAKAQASRKSNSTIFPTPISPALNAEESDSTIKCYL